MPTKRSKSKERERKARARLRMSDDDKAAKREKDREAKRSSRMERGKEEIESDKGDKRRRMRELRGRKGPSELEFIRIEMKHTMRERRKLRDGKDLLFANLNARKGMRILKNGGNLREFSRRQGGKSEEMRDWESYFRACKENADILESKKPHLVQVFNKKVRDRTEREIQILKTVEGKPSVDNDGVSYETITKENIEEFRKQERFQYEGIMKKREKEKNKKRAQKEQETKDLMKLPFEALPERDLCYCENNCKEREEAMSKSGYFEDLNLHKNEIGLTSRQLSIEAQIGQDVEKLKEKKKVKRKQNKSGKMEHAGPEKYKEPGSDAPRKGPFSWEGRSPFNVNYSILMVLTEILPGRRPNIRVCSQEEKPLFRPWEHERIVTHSKEKNNKKVVVIQ